MDLFDQSELEENSAQHRQAAETSEEALRQAQPLAARMRPRTVEEVIGQQHVLGEGKLLRRLITADKVSSIILYGPPGTGKTTLAGVIAQSTQARFVRLSGIESNVAQMRKELERAGEYLRSLKRPTILFVDEIHRFNKNQQDILLPEVENGRVRFIGATTHNPYFYINSPLVSRSQVFQLEPLGEDDVVTLLERALADEERGFGSQNIEAAPEALRHLAKISDGDARRALGALELGILSASPGEDGVIRFTLDDAQECIQRKAVVYDGKDDEHYDTISAFIKSMRGSDPDAALYWLAKMLYAGEDIRFIARRIVICASEDVGMADPQALQVAIAAQQAVEFVGMPEAQIPLAQATVHIATAPKSNRGYAGINAAMKDVKEGRTLPVPRALRDSHYKGSKNLGHGKGYQYSHDSEEGYIPQMFLPEGRRYYDPTEHGYEARVKKRLEYWRELFEKEFGPDSC